MAVTIPTSRGSYRLAINELATGADGFVSFTAALERSDGIERVAFRCRIYGPLIGESDAPAIAARLGAWLSREFEATREAALKSIRTERRPLEIVFDPDHPGPFA